MKSNSQFGRDPSQYNGHAVAGGMAAASAISSALATGILNAMNDNALAAGRAITLEEWAATVNYLEAWCQKFGRTVKEQATELSAVKLENLKLRAELEIARFRATTRH